MDLTKGSIWQLLRKVTIPASTGSLFQTFYNLVDTYFAGRISPEALAAIAKSWPIYFIAIAVAVGIGAGTTALISNSIGAKEDRKASMYVAQSIVLAIVISIFVTLFGLNFSDELLRIMGSTEESIILTREYLDIIFFGAIIVLVQLSLNGTLNAQGDTKSYRNVLIFTFFLNIFLNPLFIFGYGFIPPLGVAGIGYATILVNILGVFLILLKVLKSKRIVGLSIKYFVPNTNLLKKLFFQSAPISAALLLISVGNFIILTYIGVFGEYAVAGFGSATRFEQILLLPVLGLNTAIISIIGQNFGAKNFLRVLIFFSNHSIPL